MYVRSKNFNKVDKTKQNPKKFSIITEINMYTEKEESYVRFHVDVKHCSVFLLCRHLTLHWSFTVGPSHDV